MNICKLSNELNQGFHVFAYFLFHFLVFFKHNFYTMLNVRIKSFIVTLTLFLHGLT
jgi:hypothetical protein